MQYLKLNKHKSCSRASSIAVKPLIGVFYIAYFLGHLTNYYYFSNNFSVHNPFATKFAGKIFRHNA